MSWLKDRTLKLVKKFIQRKNGAILFYNRGEEPKVFNFVRRVAEETGMLLAIDEAYQVYSLAKKATKIKGDMAEVGVYRGGSAKIIAEVKGEKALYLFDTFEGLPPLSNQDNPGHFHQHQFPSSFAEVKELLKNYPEVFIYKGFFPATADPIKDKTFSFVNLDTDLYESTLDCLEFFYPRINRGGILLSHDYPKAIGVKKAFDEFFKNKPEIILEAPSRQQCLIVKL